MCGNRQTANPTISHYKRRGLSQVIQIVETLVRRKIRFAIKEALDRGHQPRWGSLERERHRLCRAAPQAQESQQDAEALACTWQRILPRTCTPLSDVYSPISTPH